MDSLNQTEHQSKKDSASQNRAQYQPKESQFDPSQLETEKVQLWSDSGTMRGVIPAVVAKHNVESRSCFVISPQAIQELPIKPSAAPQPRKAPPRVEPAKAAHTPCPFCNSKQTKLDTSGRGWPHSIRCDTCGACGPLSKNEKEAVSRWNNSAAELERVEVATATLRQQRDELLEAAKAAQPHWTPEIVAAIYSRGVYPFKDLADAHNAELERVNQQRGELSREVTRLNRGIVNDIAERERQTESNQTPSEYDLSIIRQRDELLALVKHYHEAMPTLESTNQIAKAEKEAK